MRKSLKKKKLIFDGISQLREKKVNYFKYKSGVTQFLARISQIEPRALLLIITRSSGRFNATMALTPTRYVLMK